MLLPAAVLFLQLHHSLVSSSTQSGALLNPLLSCFLVYLFRQVLHRQLCLESICSKER